MLPTHMLLPAVCFKTRCSCVFGSCINFLQGFQQFLLLPEQKGKNIFPQTLYLDKARLILSLQDLHDCLLRGKNQYPQSRVWTLCSAWMCTWGPSAWFSASLKTHCCDPCPCCWGAVSRLHSGFLFPGFRGNKIMRQCQLYKSIKARRRKKNV